MLRTENADELFLVEDGALELRGGVAAAEHGNSSHVKDSGHGMLAEDESP